MNHYLKETRDKISQGSCGKPMSTTRLPNEGQDSRNEDLLMFEVCKIELQIKHKIFVSQESCGKTMSTTRFDLLRPLCYGGVHEQ